MKKEEGDEKLKPDKTIAEEFFFIAMPRSDGRTPALSKALCGVMYHEKIEAFMNCKAWQCHIPGVKVFSAYGKVGQEISDA